MKKNLITVDNLEERVCAAYGKLYTDGALLTPGAKDALAKKHIRVIYGPRPPDDPCHDGAGQDCSGCAGGNSPAESVIGSHAGNSAEDLLIGVAAVLRRQYNITDPDQLKDMTLNVVKTLQERIL